MVEKWTPDPGQCLNWIESYLALFTGLTAGTVTKVCFARLSETIPERYSVELTTWLVAKRPTLRPAIENPKSTKAFIDSLNQRNKTDGLDARGLAFYGVERHPAPYEPLSKTRQELRELNRYRDALVAQRTALKNRLHEKSSSKIVTRM